LHKVTPDVVYEKKFNLVDKRLPDVIINRNDRYQSRNNKLPQSLSSVESGKKKRTGALNISMILNMRRSS